MTAPERDQFSSRSKQVDSSLPKPKADIEVGVSLHLPFVTPYKEAWETLRDDEITTKQLAAMRQTDGQARALYRLITLPIRSALKGATFVPEGHVDGGEDEAAFIEQMFTMPMSAGGMAVPFNRVIAQMLMAIFDGFSAFELVYWSPKDGPLKGKWTLKKIASRPAETLTFLIDDNSEFAGFRQQTMYQGRHIDVRLPKEHCVYYAANEEERPFYGQSYFQSAFYHWDKKFKLYAIAHIAAQRAAVGTRVGKMPANPNQEEKNKFRQALADLGVAQYMTIPDNYSVESLKEAAGFDFLAYINHHNSQMSKSVLAGFFDKEQGGGDAGKLVDFGTQSDALFMLMLQTIMGEVEEVINQKIIPRFIDWNFNSKKYPLFQFGSLSEEQKSAALDLFKTLATAGQSLTIRPEFVHELEVQMAEVLGLEMDWEAIEEKMAEEEAQAQEMLEQQALMGDPAAGGAPAGGAPADGAPAAGAAKQGHAQIDPGFIPEGFTLSTNDSDDDKLALAQLAGQLIAEATETLEATRGKPNSGGPKFVRSAEGARVYGVPVGSPITRDMQQKKAGAHGVKGKEYGKNNTAKGANKSGDTSAQKKTPTKRDTLGGGKGDQGNLGGVVTEGNSSMNDPKRTFTNPKVPGARLIDYGDGTVAIVDADGRMSPRQKFSIQAFVKFGWTVDLDDGGEKNQGGGSGAKTGDAKPANKNDTKK